MPGIFGACLTEGKTDLSGLMERMQNLLNPQLHLRAESYLDDAMPFFMGRVSLGLLNPVSQPVSSTNGLVRTVFHGELYDNASVDNDPSRFLTQYAGCANGNSAPDFVINGYLSSGDRFIRDISGIFHGAIFDKTNNQLKLFSDKFGLQPLYYAIIPNGILFAGEVKALLAYEPLKKDLDLNAVADFLHYGQVLGNKTLFTQVQLLPPGTMLTFDLNSGKVSLEEYFRLDSLFAKGGTYDSKAGEFEAAELLVKAVTSRCAGEGLGLSLSGGLDSRAILAAMGQQAKGLATYTLGLPGCADEKLAAQMARTCGTAHEFIPLGSDYLADFAGMASNMIHLSDGLYHPHESTEMLALDYFKKAPFRILLRGHGGELAKASLAYPVMATQALYDCRTPEQVLNFIFNQTNLVIRDIDPGKLFQPAFRDIFEQAPMSSWGLLIKQGVDSMEEYPWLLVFPSLALSMTLFSLNFLGDGLRDALDPRSSKD